MKTPYDSYLKYAQFSIQDILHEFGTSEQLGLSNDQAQERLNRYGANQLPEHVNTWWQLLLAQFASPFIYLLVAIGITELLVRDISNALIIFLVVLINVIVGFYQEYKAERSIQLLKKYLVSKITVIRDGKEQKVPSFELTIGDILLLFPGDIIPADIRFIKTDNVQVDQAALTGESGPVYKQEYYNSDQKNVEADSTIGFAGTTLLSGKAVGVVIAIGSKSALGSIASLTNQKQRMSGFAIEIDRFSKFILYLIIGTVLLVFTAHVLINYEHISLLNIAIFSIALGVTIIPEALPVVTVFGFTRGALRLAKNKVIVKRLSAIEDLGGIEVLCTDKTGTLTENKLSISSIFGQERDVMLYSVLASGMSARALNESKGFDSLLWKSLSGPEHDTLNKYLQLHEIPFDPALRYSLVLYKLDHTYELIMRGAPQDVLEHCTIDNSLKNELDEWLFVQGQKGNRIIAIAKNHYTQLDEDAIDIKQLNHSMKLIGLIAFEDPLKKTAVHAIEKAKQLGIQIKILSGDSQQVCAAIGKQCGLIQNETQVISGNDFANQSLEMQKKIVREFLIFARTKPEQKYAIIQLLQEEFKVGYMGDGINDAPPLKIAQVALAVDDAADIARDAADIILLRKSLNVVINGIEEGRIIFANTLKYIKITLASSFGHFYALAISSLLIDFLPMLPIQLIMVNFMTDIPLIALSTDTVSPKEIKAPQKYDIKEIIIIATILGLVITTFDFLLFSLFYDARPTVLQTNWFISCILNELACSFSARSNLPIYQTKRPSKEFILLSIFIIIITFILPYTYFGQTWFYFFPPSLRDMAIIIVLAIGCFITTECVKQLYFRFYKNSGM